MLTLWWSLLWRFAGVLLAAVFVVGLLVQLVVQSIDAMAPIQVKPTVLWGLLAIGLWLLAAAPQFFESVLWGERLRLSPAQWQTIGRGLALFFVLLGLLNVAVWKFGTIEAWVNFKVWAPLPLLAGWIALVCARVRPMR